MKNINDLISPAALQAAWTHSTWGVVAIDVNGNVVAANPAFVHCTGIEVSAVLGISEADFNHALLNASLLECLRVEVAIDGLRAIYQIRCDCCSTKYNSHDPRLSRVAEMLREPLASIYGFTELLLTQNYDEVTRIGLTASMLEQVEVMSNLINEQLDVRKLK